jgi:hypothetical protein
MSADVLDKLRLRAMEQRNQLHETANELKHKINDTREKLDINRNVRAHFGTVTGIVAGVAMLTGYAVADGFLNR